MSARLELVPWSAALDPPLVTARGARSTRRGWWVRLSADVGEGLGEAACWPGFGAGVRATRRALRRAAAEPLLLTRLSAAALAGDEPALQAALERSPAGAAPEARAALETAALDLAAREGGRPLAAWLWPAPRERVLVHALVSDAAGARRAVAEGAEALKLKVGFEAAPAERARLSAVRAAVGPAVRLRLDANGAWSADEALRRLEGLAPLGIDLIEQPVPAGDLDGLRRTRAAGVPVAADEGLRGPEDLEALLRAAACDAVVLKPLFLGGLLPARALALRSVGAGLRVIVTHGLESAVGRAAALALAAGLPDLREPHGLGPALRGEPAPQGGALRPAARPGLGLNPLLAPLLARGDQRDRRGERPTPCAAAGGGV